MSPAVTRFWAEYLDQAGSHAAPQAWPNDIFCIGSSAEGADNGARLIVAGIKTATSSLLWEYETTRNPVPSEGWLSVLLDGHAEPVCVVETTWLKVQPFNQIDAQFARDYGEWDRTLKTWQDKCWAYYADQCKAINRLASPEMPLVCERFRVVFVEI